MIEKLYTVEEVAELASVTGRTIRNYLKSGRLVGRKIGGQWRFPETEVQRLLTGAESAGFEEEETAAVEETGSSFSAQVQPEPTDSAFAPSREETRPPYRSAAGYVPPAPLPSPETPSFESAAQPAVSQPASRPVSQPVVPAQPEAVPHHEALTPRPLAPYTPAASSCGPCEEKPFSNYSRQAEPEPVFSEPEWPSAAQPAAPAPPPAYRSADASVSNGTSAYYQPPSERQAPPVQSAPASPPVAKPQEPPRVNHPPQPSYSAPRVVEPDPPAPPYRPTEPTPAASAEYPLYASYAPPASAVQSSAAGYPAHPYQNMAFPAGYGFPLYGQAMQTPVYASGMPGYYTTAVPMPAPAAENVKTEEPPAAPPSKPEVQAAERQTADEPANYPPPPQKPVLPEEPSLSEVGKRVTRFISEVHDCSSGPLVCSVVDLYQSLSAAKTTSERLAEIARQESDQGVLCQSFVEYDERYYVARYTLLGSSSFLLRCLKLIG